MKILVVDDSMMMRRAIQRGLAGLGDIEVIEATNGAKALELFKLHLPTVATMDITMPEMDGLSCVRKIIECGTGIRILVISSLEDRHTAVEVIKAGAKGFLCKPFTPEELIESVQEMINYQGGGNAS
jgi:two-component system, chemotaxis family, chemotaxis protein CheY